MPAKSRKSPKYVPLKRISVDKQNLISQLEKQNSHSGKMLLTRKCRALNNLSSVMSQTKHMQTRRTRNQKKLARLCNLKRDNQPRPIAKLTKRPRLLKAPNKRKSNQKQKLEFAFKNKKKMLPPLDEVR